MNKKENKDKINKIPQDNKTSPKKEEFPLNKAIKHARMDRLMKERK